METFRERCGRELKGPTVLGMALFLLVPHLAWVGLADYGLLKDLAVMLLALLWWGAFMDGGTLSWLRSRMWPWGWVGLGSISVPLAWAPDPLAGLGQLAFWALVAVFGIACGRHIAASPQRGRALLGVIAVSAAITSVLGLGQLFGIIDWPEQVRAPAATFSNRNVAAHWLVVAWPATLILLAGARTVLGRIAALATVLLVPVLLILSGSKAGVGILVFQSGVLLWLSRPPIGDGAAIRWRRVFRWGGGIFFFGAIGLYLWQDGASRMEEMGGERFWRPTLRESASTRVEASAAAWRMLLDRPLGVGAGQFERIYPRYESTGSDWSPNLTRRQGALHNDWLQLMVEGGVLLIPILGLSAAVFGRSLWRAGRDRRHAQEPDPSPRFAFAVLTGLGVLGLVSFPFQGGLTLFAAFFMVGVLSFSRKESPDESTGWPSQRDRRHQGWRWALTLAMLGTGGWLAVKQVVADALFYRQAGAYARGDMDLVESYGLALSKWWPRHEKGADLLGRIWLKEGDFARAEMVYAQLLERWPEDPAYLYHESLALAGLGKPAEALVRLEPLAQRYSGEASLHFLLGTQRFGVGDFNRAYVAFHEAARLDPGNSLYAHNTGVAAERAGWPTLAIEAYTYALRLNPQNEISRQRLEALRRAE